ncbi:MAG: HDOD domain-containing protein [Planctomycetes bacterium]|nr:HDOD domain-containing protein [Planctomycetota bacterium]
MKEVLIGRQAIFDDRMKVWAYELCFRYGTTHALGSVTPGRATASVLTEALTTFGLDQLVGAQVASINVPREFVLMQPALPVAPERLLIEVSAREGGDLELVTALHAWRSRGFRVAIDDVKHDDPALEELYAAADVLKVDCLGRRLDDLKFDVRRLVRHRKSLLAEKLESRREVEDCKAMGFTLFQGYFLERPGMLRTRAVAANQAALVQLVVELQDPDCDVDRIEAVVQRDPGITYRLLRCVNSAAYGLSRRIESLHEAIVFLGAATVRNLTCLLLISNSGDQPRELLRMAMFRARLCELFAAACGFADRSRHFTVGLLSLFGALLEQPLETLLADLPVSKPLEGALLRFEGDAGRILAGLQALERADWSLLLAMGQAPESIQQCWMDAVKWVEEIDGLLLGTTPRAKSVS